METEKVLEISASKKIKSDVDIDSEALDVAKKLGLDRQAKFYQLELDDYVTRKVTPDVLIKRIMEKPETFLRMTQDWYADWIREKCFRFYNYRIEYKLTSFLQREDKTQPYKRDNYNSLQAIELKSYPLMLPKGALFAVSKVANRFEHLYILDPDLQTKQDPVIFGIIGMSFYEIYWWDKKKEGNNESESTDGAKNQNGV